MTMFRFLPILAFTGLAACTDLTGDLAGPVEPLGDFTLGFSEVVAPNLQKLLVSRDATEEEWIEAVDKAVERRFGRFDGTKFYHFGISVEGYSLPPPVVPGKSYLAIRVTVWDDASQSKMAEEPKLITQAELFESRVSRSREETIERLAQGAALLIESWLREQQELEGWCVPDPVTEEALEEAAETDQAVAEPEPGPQPDGSIRPVGRPDGLTDA